MNELHYQLDLLKAMNQKLLAKEKMYQMICDASSCAFLYYSADKNEISTAGQWDALFPFEIKEVKDLERLLDVVDENFLLSLRDVLYLEKRGLSSASVECMHVDKRGWLEFCVYAEYDENGELRDKLVSIENITKLKKQREDLIYMAHFDGMTGLYNRNYFVTLLGEFVRKAEEHSHIVSVLVIDIDDFKKINDGLGMVSGDELIQLFGMFLKDLTGEDVIVCHLSNDVYCIAIYNPSGTNSVNHICQLIRERTRRSFCLSDGNEVNITVSMGVAEYPESATSALDLINCAEIVMFRCKDIGKNTVQYFNADILNDFLNNIAMENKLKDAVFNSNFLLHYQPQYYSGNKKLRGVEALIRWKDETGHMISPSVFIPIAEKNGCILSIGSWVVEQSIAQFAKWRLKYGYPFTLSINISAVQYNSDEFVDSLSGIIQKYGVNPNEIELEITESILINDFEKVTEKLKLLHGMGIRVSLDDFGTGFSSLSYLKKFPIDTLKIDKSFIDTVLSDTNTRIITESIINMVKSLGFESVAEGVETEQQYQYLRAVGCDVIQGYLLGKPQSAEEIDKSLQEMV